MHKLHLKMALCSVWNWDKTNRSTRDQSWAARWSSIHFQIILRIQALICQTLQHGDLFWRGLKLLSFGLLGKNSKCSYKLLVLLNIPLSFFSCWTWNNHRRKRSCHRKWPMSGDIFQDSCLEWCIQHSSILADHSLKCNHLLRILTSSIEQRL